MHESVKAIRLKGEEPLVEQHVNRLPSGTLNHEFGTGLAEDRCRVVDELAGIRLYPEVDAALRVNRRTPLRDHDGFGITPFRG